MPTYDPVYLLQEHLRRIHGEIKSTETEAQDALYNRKDNEAYQTLMRRKAELVSGLFESSEHLLTALPEPQQTETARTLAKFSRGGYSALEVDSVFYMSALLYPDDHQTGAPDNLERLITELGA